MACNFIPSCAFHPKTPLSLSMSLMAPVPVEWNGKKTAGYAMDLTMNCPDCGYREMFGVAIAESEWEWMRAAMKRGTSHA